jgi:hypothetical protein
MTTTRIPLLEIGSLQSRLTDLIAKKGEPPWSEAVVLTDDIQAFLICHPFPRDLQGRDLSDVWGKYVNLFHSHPDPRRHEVTPTGSLERHR